MSDAWEAPPSPEVKALLQKLLTSIRVDTTQRDCDMALVINLLTKYLRNGLAFHYGAPALPDEEWR